MEFKDYYKTLGVDRKASADDIKRAYRKLARKYHPDVSKEPNAEEQFKNVQEAYEVLKDTEKRSAYDELGSNWKSGQEFRPPPGWDFSQFYHSDQGGGGGGGFTESDLGGFSEFFTNLFGHTRGQSRFGREEFGNFRQRGTDQHAKISISLEDAFHGTAQTLQLQIPELDRSGAIHQKVRTLKVNIPAGAHAGQQLRLAGQGSPGVGGGPAGDIYLEIAIDPHRLFSLHGRDIYLTLPVSPWEAALGAEIKVPTLGGPVGLKLPAGSQSGQKLRLKGRGMPGKAGSGDQYVVIQIHIPSAQTEEQREYYKKMAEMMPYDPRKDWHV